MQATHEAHARGQRRQRRERRQATSRQTRLSHAGREDTRGRASACQNRGKPAERGGQAAVQAAAKRVAAARHASCAAGRLQCALREEPRQYTASERLRSGQAVCRLPRSTTGACLPAGSGCCAGTRQMRRRERLPGRQAGGARKQSSCGVSLRRCLRTLPPQMRPTGGGGRAKGR
jgi:hypothetical protein